MKIEWKNCVGIVTLATIILRRFATCSSSRSAKNYSLRLSHFGVRAAKKECTSDDDCVNAMPSSTVFNYSAWCDNGICRFMNQTLSVATTKSRSFKSRMSNLFHNSGQTSNNSNSQAYASYANPSNHYQTRASSSNQQHQMRTMRPPQSYARSHTTTAAPNQSSSTHLSSGGTSQQQANVLQQYGFATNEEYGNFLKTMMPSYYNVLQGDQKRQ